MLTVSDQAAIKRTRVLSEAQQTASNDVLKALRTGDIVVLQGRPGSGKSTILRHVHASIGGAFVAAADFMRNLRTFNPIAIEEALLALLEATLDSHDLVIMDDLHMIVAVVNSCDYNRCYLLDVVLTAIVDAALSKGKRLLFAVEEDTPAPLSRRAYFAEIPKFGPLDYAALYRAYLDSSVEVRIDFAEVHRFAPMLDAHQLKNAAIWLGSQDQVTTKDLIDHLTSKDLASNVEIEEVDPVDWKDLKGVDELIAALEMKVAFPFENDMPELHLKPKRGILLAGPPGTGKTTIGRALAHRLKGKFFLIDGTMIAGSSDFYREINNVFAAATRNAPSVIFIDDADVIFEGEGDRGFYRYLLTKLDGLESASAGRVCVMMTAMQASSLPAAVLRSGRVELWLETRLPDQRARAEIIIERLAGLPDPLATVDVDLLASATKGLTGADLKAVVEDGKLLFAYDKVNGRPPRPVSDYFLEAIGTVRANRRNYARRKSVQLTESVPVGFKVL